MRPASFVPSPRTVAGWGKIFDAAIKEGRSPLTRQSENDDWLSGLDLLVPLTFVTYADSQAVLQYDKANGKAQLHTLQTTGAATLTKAYQWSSGWEIMEPLAPGYSGRPGLLCYDKHQGHVRIYTIDQAGGMEEDYRSQWGANWEFMKWLRQCTHCPCAFSEPASPGP